MNDTWNIKILNDACTFFHEGKCLKNIILSDESGTLYGWCTKKSCKIRID